MGRDAVFMRVKVRMVRLKAFVCFEIVMGSRARRKQAGRQNSRPRASLCWYLQLMYLPAIT